MRRNWTREELILAINLYCKTPFGKIHNRNPELIKLAKVIGRTPSALSWKLVNFASLDPTLKKRGIKGATNISHLDREIWQEFYSDWDRLAYESELLRAKQLGEQLEAENTLSDQMTEKSGATRDTVVKVRINQSFFRATVLAAYDNKCCVTGLAIPELLIASHILPWSEDEKNRMNPTNGLCLNALHDRAFDRGYMTITPDYRIEIAKRVRVGSKKNDPTEAMLLRFHGKKILLPKKFLPDVSFLTHHNEKIFQR
jgi:putative restriction endonuclease